MVIIQLLAIAAVALTPALIWLAFFLREDEHPEPPMLLAKIFAMGMLASVPALVLQLFFQNALGNPDTGFAYSIFVFAATEELFKFFGAYVVVNNSPDFDEPVDAMIYMVTAGLGFATVENLFVVGSLAGLSGTAGLLAAGETLFLRLVGATLLHTLASAMIGYYWAKGVLKEQRMKYIFLGVLVAIIVHGIFNYFVHIFEDINLLFPTLFLVAVSFFVFADFEKLKDIRP